MILIHEREIIIKYPPIELKKSYYSYNYQSYYMNNGWNIVNFKIEYIFLIPFLTINYEIYIYKGILILNKIISVIRCEICLC